MQRFTIILCFLFAILFTGCFGNVRWEERQGGDSNKMNWIPVCPACGFVMDYDRLQCINPNCNMLLNWKDKIVYPENCDEWLEDEIMAASQQEEDKEREHQQKEEEQSTEESSQTSEKEQSVEESSQTSEKENASQDTTENTEESQQKEEKQESDDDWDFSEDAW